MTDFDKYINDLIVKTVDEHRKQRDRQWFIAVVVIVGAVMSMCLYNLRDVI